MRQQDKPRYNKLVRRRERKRLKRQRISKYSERSPYYKIVEFKKRVDRQIIKKFHFPLYNFLAARKFVDGTENLSANIEMPKDFSFATNYEGSMSFIRDFVASVIDSLGGELQVSFKECEKADQPALFVFQILRLEMIEQFRKFDRKLSVLSVEAKIEIEPSKNDEVNKLLLVGGLVGATEVKVQGLIPRRGVGFLKGSKSQRLYSENKKGAITTKIRDFINSCLRDHGHEFNSEGINEMDGLLSEILGNGEDHSPFDTYYSTANSFVEADRFVGEVNLSVMNFGYSIYEGLELSKKDNYENYKVVERLYDQVIHRIKNRTIGREDLFTLYALQEGISRLKFEDQSRGHGTMKFINSFFALGDFEDISKHYHPELTIISGSTQVICNKKYKPFSVNEQNFLSLNSENDLSRPPDPSNLKHLKSSFPGTILYVKIYLNKEHLRRKIDGDS